jgi:hypothetical protein
VVVRIRNLALSYVRFMVSWGLAVILFMKNDICSVSKCNETYIYLCVVIIDIVDGFVRTYRVIFEDPISQWKGEKGLSSKERGLPLLLHRFRQR